MVALIYLIIGSLLSAFIGFFLNAIFHDKIRDIMGTKRFKRFWGSKNQKFTIVYPMYGITRYDRCEAHKGGHISTDDQQGIQSLTEAFRNRGYKVNVISDVEAVRESNQLSSSVIVLCSPKLDPATGNIVLDTKIGGNLFSTKLYKNKDFRNELGIKFRIEKGIKKIEIWNKNSSKFTPEISPIDDEDIDEDKRNEDIAYAARIPGENITYFLIWGIHGLGTKGAAKYLVDERVLKKNVKNNIPEKGKVAFKFYIPFKTDEKINIRIPDKSPRVTDRIEFPTGSNEGDTIPDPFSLNGNLDEYTPIYGIGYLWATKENVKYVKNGEYEKLKPVIAEFDLSLECDYGCVWCAYDHVRNKPDAPGIIETGTYETIINNLKYAGIKILLLTGGGEPAKSDELEEVVGYAKKNKMWVSLYTNLYHYTWERFEKLFENGLDELRVSLDDISSEENYRKIHTKAPPDAYNKVRKNLQYALDCRNFVKPTNSFRRCIIGASFLVADRNSQNIKDSINKLIDWTADISPLDYTLFRPPVNYWGNPGKFINDPDGIFEIVKEASKDLRFSQATCQSLVAVDRFSNLKKGNVPPYGVCRAANLWAEIASDGNAYFCCERKYEADFKIGPSKDLPPKSKPQCITDWENASAYGELHDHCPISHCKPAALNMVFQEIEDERRNTQGRLSNRTERWLDKLSTYREIFPIGPACTVSGNYKENDL
jgi:organic radical activating enzyme